jgi:WD40 repeat protein
MFDRSLVTSGFDTETLVSEEYLTYLMLAQIEAGFLPLEMRLIQSAIGADPGFDVTVIVHPPTEYQRRYEPEPTALLPQSVPGSFTAELLPEDPNPMASIAFHPNGQRLASGSPDGFVRVWDIDRGTESIAFKQSGSATSLAYTPDGTRLVTASIDGRIRLWDAAAGVEVMTLPGHAGPAFAVSISADGTRVVSGGSDRAVRLSDLQTGAPLKVFHGHGGPVLGLAFAPSGNRIASASLDGTVRIWDPASGSSVDVPPGQEIHVLSGHGGAVRSAAYSPSGQRIASGGADGTVRIWNAETGASVATLTGHDAAVNALAFNPAGTRIASGSADREARLWPSQGGSAIRILRGHRKPVLSVAFSGDGSRLASGSEDNTVRLWRMPGGQAQGFLSVPFMALNAFVTVVDNRSGEERAELPAGLLLALDLEADRTADGLERNHMLRLSLVRLSDLTRALLEAAGIDFRRVEQRIRERLDRTLALGMAQGLAVQQLRMRKFVGPSQRSLGLYVDLTLKSGPETGAFVPARGSLGLAQDFRDPARPLAFSTSPGLFALLGPDLKFRQAEETATGSGDFRFPLREDPFDRESDEIGRIKSINVGPEISVGPNQPPQLTGRLVVDVHGEYTDAPLDPDFNLRLFFRPKTEDGILEWDIDVSVNFGLLATLFLMAVGIGLALLFTPTIGWGSAVLVGTILGLAVLKGLIAEPLAARMVEGRVEEGAQAAFLDALPARVPAALRRWDPFYVTQHQVAVRVDQVFIDTLGIAFEGTAITLDKQPRPETHVVIRDEERAEDGTITALRYRVRDFQNIVTDLEANAPGRDRMDFRRGDPQNEPTLVSLTDAEVALRIEAGRILAPINYTPERIYLVDNSIALLLCLSRIERAEARGRLLREFRAATANAFRIELGDMLRAAATQDLEEALGRPPTEDEIRAEVDKRIEALVDQRQPDFEEQDLPGLLEEAVAQVLRFDLTPAEWAERWRAGVLALPDDKEIITRRNADGTTTTYIRDRPDGVAHDNLLSLARYSPPYQPPE